jgi:hypothetical protein
MKIALFALLIISAPSVSASDIGSRSYGAPSILPQCLDSGKAAIGFGPTLRAKECTRQYCARPEYRKKITAYAMNQRQSQNDQTEALTCITRSEQDQAKK